jgi:hypothetical protein
VPPVVAFIKKNGEKKNKRTETTTTKIIVHIFTIYEPVDQQILLWNMANQQNSAHQLTHSIPRCEPHGINKK